MSAELLREAARVMRADADGVGLPLTSPFMATVATVLEKEAAGDGRRPHRYPSPAPDAEIIAWRCQACGQTVREFGPIEEPNCPVDWRPRNPLLVDVARVFLGRDT